MAGGRRRALAEDGSIRVQKAAGAAPRRLPGAQAFRARGPTRRADLLQRPGVTRRFVASDRCGARIGRAGATQGMWASRTARLLWVKTPDLGPVPHLLSRLIYACYGPVIDLFSRSQIGVFKLHNPLCALGKSNHARLDIRLASQNHLLSRKGALSESARRMRRKSSPVLGEIIL
jgi:hypothetical protein